MREYYVFVKNRDERVGYLDKCILWWRPEGKGYTTDLNKAGIYTDEDMRKGYPCPKRCQYVPKELADALAFQPRLLWWDHPDYPSVKNPLEQLRMREGE